VKLERDMKQKSYGKNENNMEIEREYKLNNKKEGKKERKKGRNVFGTHKTGQERREKIIIAETE